MSSHVFLIRCSLSCYVKNISFWQSKSSQFLKILCQERMFLFLPLLLIFAALAACDDPLQDVYTCKDKSPSVARILLISPQEEFGYYR